LNPPSAFIYRVLYFKTLINYIILIKLL